MTAARKQTNDQRFASDMKFHRGIDFAFIGMMVEVDGDIGTIVGMNSSANLDVLFANQLKYGKGKSNCHPFWRVKYFDAKGELIAHHDGSRWLLRPV